MLEGAYFRYPKEKPVFPIFTWPTYIGWYQISISFSITNDPTY